jgi:serine/threonine protein kinase
VNNFESFKLLEKVSRQIVTKQLGILGLGDRNMHDDANSNKQWISSLSEGGVGFKVWDSTFDLEMDGEFGSSLTRDFDGELMASTPLPTARKVSDDPFAELVTSPRAPLVIPRSAEDEISDDVKQISPLLSPAVETALQAEPGVAEMLPASQGPDVVPQQMNTPAVPQPRPNLRWESTSQTPFVEEEKAAQPAKREKPVIIIDNTFQIVSQLGKGVMCNVYKVKDLRSGTLMVLKMLPKEAWADQEILRRAQSEAQVISRLQHDNLIPFRAFGATSDGKPYILMDYLHGITLLRAIKAADGLPLPRVVQVMEQLCHGLAAAHGAGVPHRDIRPENIMFLSKKGDYHLKLVDFGLAKLISEGIEPMKVLEATGDIFGNPPYMSPEECRGDKTDARSDIYSIGCVMYTAMTGQAPFAGTSTPETLKKQIKESLPAPSKIKRSIASTKQAGWVSVTDLEYIVMKCLEKNPKDRYQKVEDILVDLDKLRKSIQLQQIQQKAASGLRTAEFAAPGTGERRALSPVLIAIITAVVIAAAGVGFLLMPKPAPQTVSPDLPRSQQLPPAPPASEDAKHIETPPTPPMEMPPGSY